MIFFAQAYDWRCIIVAACPSLCYTCYVSTFWGIPARVTHIVVASLPYGLLVSISSNPDNTNTKSSINEGKWNKHNRNVNSIATVLCRSKGKVLRQSASVSSDATDAEWRVGASLWITCIITTWCRLTPHFPFRCMNIYCNNIHLFITLITIASLIWWYPHQ